MGIRFYCPNGHKLNVKTFQAGHRGICPFCGVSVQIPTESTRPSSKEMGQQQQSSGTGPYDEPQAPAAEPSVAQSDPEGPVLPEAPVDASREPFGQPAPQAAEARHQVVETPVFTAPIGESAAFTSPDLQGAAVAGANPSNSAATPAPSVTPEPHLAEPAERDPLVEAPDAVWYVRPPSGGQFGPATAQIMRNWLNDGRVGADSLVWREGWRDWQEANGVFPQLGGMAHPTPHEVVESGPGDSTGSRGSYPPRPRRARNPATNPIIITVLILAVIVLFVVFVYVLIDPP